MKALFKGQSPMGKALSEGLSNLKTIHSPMNSEVKAFLLK